MLDFDLGPLFSVETRTLDQAVKRHLDRFPADFIFHLTADKFNALKSQIAISNTRGVRRHRPYAFTKQGVAMLSSVRKSPRAVQVNIEIMRTFVKLRQMLASHEDLARQLAALERNTTISSRWCSTLSANS